MNSVARDSKVQIQSAEGASILNARFRASRLRQLLIGICLLGFSWVLGFEIWSFTFTTRSLAAETVFPGKSWTHCPPAEVQLSAGKLAAFSEHVAGRGCVVRHGRMAFTWGDQSRSYDVASAMKPVLSTMLFIAIEEGRLKGADERVADIEPRLLALNGGKDAAITWRHLGSQTSGYGLVEKPGDAWSYNDFALALYHDTLMEKVFKQAGLDVFRSRLLEPMQFEDAVSFDKPRAGRLALSVRDFARFGLLCLHRGRWGERQLVSEKSFDAMLGSLVPASLPRTSGREAPMLEGQRSIGGSRNITPAGPGFYSFNWWLNKTNALGQRLYRELPHDTFIAAGHGGKRMLLVVPAWHMVVSWNDSVVDDHDNSPGDASTRANRATRLLREAVLDAAPPGK
jgi:CubicO group peptidase (beta-lactamase class C family)